jgi:hypothetical protein
MPAVWRHSMATLLGVIDDLDCRLAPLERDVPWTPGVSLFIRAGDDAGLGHP